MKTIIKRFIGKCFIKFYGIKKHGKNIYIGLHTKIVNGKILFLMIMCL